MTPSKNNRNAKGQFPPGTSGNPKGRPKSETAVLRARLASEAESIIQVVLDQAKNGDLAAAKLVLDRIVPPLKPTATAVTVPLPDTKTPASIAEAILASATSGQIPSDIAGQLIQATANLSRIIEIDELKARLEALENALNPTKFDSKKEQ